MKFTGKLARRHQTDIRGIATLLALYHLGGKARAAEVLDLLEEILEPVLTHEDIRPEFRGKYRTSEHRWHHLIHGTMSHPQLGLRNNGFVVPAAASEHGIWSLTNKGKLRIQALLDTRTDAVSGITLSELLEGLHISFIDGQKDAQSSQRPRSQLLLHLKRDVPSVVEQVYGESRQTEILGIEISRIHEFLRGNGSLHTNDEMLCDWIAFCYKFELYSEGAALFSCIHPEFVNPWLYERTKRLAEVCTLRKD